MARIRTGKKFNWSFDRRFMPHVEKVESGCWLWTGSKMNNGYGQVGVGGRLFAAHRFAYQELVGEIPKGLDLDHLCKNKACVNPEHMEPVTRSVNLSRRDPFLYHNERKTHCPSGHEYAGDNLYIHPTGRRCCRACARIRAWEKRNG